MKKTLLEPNSKFRLNTFGVTLGEVYDPVFKGLLRASSLLAFPVVAIGIHSSLQAGNTTLGAIFAAAYIVLLFITIFQQLPFSVRAGSLMLLSYSTGLLNLYLYGLRLDGPLYLIAFLTLVSFVYGLVPGVLALLLNLGTLAGLLTLAVNGQIYSPALLQALTGPERQGLIQIGFTFLFINGILAHTLVSLRSQLIHRFQHEQELFQAVENERMSLRLQVEKHTRDLERRLVQLRTAAEISRSLSAVLDSAQLLQQVVNLVQERFDLYYVGVFLVDENEEYAVLSAGTGEAAKKMLSYGHKLAVGGQSMIGWATKNRTARIALDVGEERVRFDNPFLPETRSELALPILSSRRLLGALTIQSKRAGDFDENDLTVLQSIADSLATAIENARLFAQEQANLEEIRNLHRQYLLEAWTHLPLQANELTYATGSPAEQISDTSAQGTALETPLILRDQVIGQLTLEPAHGEWSQEDKQFVEAVAAQAALAMENARLIEQTQRRALQERMSTEITSRVWSSNDIDTILRSALEDLSRSLQASQGLIKLEIKEGSSGLHPTSL